MEVVASHGHGKIYIIGTLRNVPFEKDSESMVNSGGHVGTVEIIEVRSRRKKTKIISK